MHDVTNKTSLERKKVVLYCFNFSSLSNFRILRQVSLVCVSISIGCPRESRYERMCQFYISKYISFMLRMQILGVCC